MPRSVVIYTSREGFVEVKTALELLFDGEVLKPYTISPAQKTESGQVRVRVTELAENVVLPFLLDRTRNAGSIFASPGDRDVRNSSFDALIEDAERFRRVATVQFVTPTIVEVLHQPMPFPVTPSMFRRYVDVWNSFARRRFPSEDGVAQHVHVTDFRVSCVKTPRGAGFQGWVALEIERGRTEEEIRLFNALIDFSFYSGTGFHTDEGLGQTRRTDDRDRAGPLR
jgi:hypothetical protein